MTQPAQSADYVSRLVAVAAAAATLLEDAEIVDKDGNRTVDGLSAKRLEDRLDALGFDPRTAQIDGSSDAR